MTQSEVDIFSRRHTFNFTPQNNYANKLHQDFIIENLVREVFTKIG